MIEIQYGQILKASWEKMKVNYGMIMAVFSILFFVMIVFAQVSRMFDDMGGAGKILGQIVSYGVNTFLSIGMIRCLLDVADDKKIELGTLFSGGDVFLDFLIAHIAYSLLCLLGMILFVIPGIFWSLKYFFVTYLIADRGVGIKEAFSISAQMTDGYKWKIFCLMFLMGLINVGGLLCLGIGLLATIPWTAVVIPVVFRMLGAVDASVEEKHMFA